jgi:nucleotide-binding universal stress UspA family protein
MEASSAKNAVQVGLILVPVDGSESAERSAGVAFQLALRYKAKVIVISVVAAPGFSFSGPAGAPADLTEYYKLGMSEAGRAVESAVRHAKELGLDVRGEVLEPVSSTVGAIIEFAEKEKVDLIVMGTRGLGGFKKLLLGSVSTGVVSHAHCAVLIVR